MDCIPKIGLGTWKMRREETHEAVVQAVNQGYRHIDCSSSYGNEAQVGSALEQLMDAGIIKREEIWITSKLPNTAHAPEDVLPAVEMSLKDLGIGYLDAYLMHWPVALRKGVWIPRKAEHFISLEEQPLEDTWAAMEKLVDAGLVRHLGVSNFSVTKLEMLKMTSRLSPKFNQVELHPYLQQNAMLDFCQKSDIQLIAYAPLGSGDRPKPLRKPDEPVLLRDSVVNEIAVEKGVAPAQVLLAWAIQRGTIAIAKSVNPVRMQTNLNAMAVTLTNEQIRLLESLDRHHRYVDGSFWVLPNGPYSLSNLWDE